MTDAVRVDTFTYEIRGADCAVHTDLLDALHTARLPLPPAWPNARLVVFVTGVCEQPFEAALAVDRVTRSAVVAAAAEPDGEFSVELTVPLAELASLSADPHRVDLLVDGRPLQLARLQLVPSALPLDPESFELREATDSLLVNAPERQLFDLQNPEEGFWIGTGRWRLRLLVDWRRGPDGDPFALDPKPSDLVLRIKHPTFAGDVVREDPARRAGGRRTYTELYVDTSHPSLQDGVPPEGVDLPLQIVALHPLSVAPVAGLDAPPLFLRWSRDVALRLRDPRTSLGAFRRLSGVGIDFGTTATVAAFTHQGYRSLMRLGSPPDARTNPAENPTVLLIEDHEKLWSELGPRTDGRRFPDLLRVVQASHAAREKLSEFPNAVVTEIKSLPERVFALDQAPQLRDREKKADFLLDEARVRMVVRAYGYLLGRAINRPGQEVFLRYWLTYPAEFDERARALLIEELRGGILLSIPEGISPDEVTVQMQATEPEAYAAEVCPELAAHPAFAPLVEKFGELRFAVFDFGGGTLDIACGRYRPATPEEETASGCTSVIETLQVAGDDHLGGDYLTHELVWLVHQHPEHLPEMEAREVPMQRPVTIPENKLARAPQLYKRSLAARQNKVRFQDALALEQVKFKRANEMARVDSLVARRLDESEVALESLKNDLAGVQKRLSTHLEERVRDGARQLASMIASTPWEPGAAGSLAPASGWRERGVVILLAGNSSRSDYVERALAQALDAPDLKVWTPTDDFAPQGVVRYETPTRFERGAEILGVTPKTAVALGALRIANRDVHLVRAAQGFSFFVGDLRGFPPKFTALLPMGTLPQSPEPFGDHYLDFGPWNGQKPLRIAKEYEPGRMSANDPRIISVRPEIPADATGRLYVCPASPTTVMVHLVLADGTAVRTTLNLAPYFA
jgi:hypothetical protein